MCAPNGRASPPRGGGRPGERRGGLPDMTVLARPMPQRTVPADGHVITFSGASPDSRTWAGIDVVDHQRGNVYWMVVSSVRLHDRGSVTATPGRPGSRARRRDAAGHGRAARGGQTARLVPRCLLI